MESEKSKQLSRQEEEVEPVEEVSLHELLNDPRLPEEYREPLSVVLSTQYSVSRWTGPLPSPESLGEFETILPGSADRIVRLAENAQQHRHIIEIDDMKATHTLSKQGQLFGFISVIGVIIAGVVLALCDKEIAGSIITASGLIGLAGAYYIYSGKAKENK